MQHLSDSFQDKLDKAMASTRDSLVPPVMDHLPISTKPESSGLAACLQGGACVVFGENAASV